MVPQQSESGRSNSPTSGTNNVPVQFGSQLVDKHSATPYTDATQVRKTKNNNNNFFRMVCVIGFLRQRHIHEHTLSLFFSKNFVCFKSCKREREKKNYKNVDELLLF